MTAQAEQRTKPLANDDNRRWLSAGNGHLPGRSVSDWRRASLSAWSALFKRVKQKRLIVAVIFGQVEQHPRQR
jgi:hypothetical protein